MQNTKTGDYQEPIYDTKVVYVNEQGTIIVDFLYDDGGAFLNGLAMVRKGNQMGYIDTQGNEVYSWIYSHE